MFKMRSVRKGGTMIKKIVALFTVTCLSLTMINSVFAQTAKDTNAVLEVAQAEFLQSEGNTSFFRWR